LGLQPKTVDESDWEDLAAFARLHGHVNTNGTHLPDWRHFHSADSGRQSKIEAEGLLAYTEPKAQTYSDRLPLALAICAGAGLPPLTAEQARIHYAFPRNNHNPMALDKGHINASAGSETWYAGWQLSVLFLEGPEALDKALGEAQKYAEAFHAALPHFQEAANYFACLAGNGTPDMWKDEWEHTPPPLALRLSS
jgi:hypothetical protein